jgi:uncharacterized protein YcbX
LIVYPVKGCRGVERYSVEVSDNGFKHDREYAVIDANGVASEYKALSQTKYPKLACLVPVSFDSNGITISSPEGSRLIHTRIARGKEYTVDFYGDKIQVIDQGDDASAWFSKYLGANVRFVSLSKSVERKTESGYSRPNSFFYRTPILLVSSESLAALSRQVGSEVSHARFRPNIVISGLSSPWLEDDTVNISIGNLKLTGSEHCERCSIPGVDQNTGHLNASLLAACRRARNGSSMKYKRYPVKDDQWYVGTYFNPSIKSADSTRICIGQNVELL